MKLSRLKIFSAQLEIYKISTYTKSYDQKPVIVLGAGGHAKVVVEALRLNGRNIIGVTNKEKNLGDKFIGINVLGDDSKIFDYSSNEVELVMGIGALPGNNNHWEITARLESEGYSFSQVIHPSAVIAQDVSLDSGVLIMAGVIIQAGAKIGRHCIVNTGCIIDHDCIIDAKCHIAPGVTLSGGVSVGKATHIGTGTSVIQNITIGSDCLIAAGSIVHEDIESNVKYVQPRHIQ